MAALSPPEIASTIATFDQWWTFGTTLAGAVIGSVVGGAISYLMARQVNREARERLKLERLERDKALAFSLVVKIAEIVSSLAALHHQNEENIAKAESLGIKGPLWTKMLPIVGCEKRIHFASEEIAVLLPLKLDSTINSLFILDDQHNSLHATMDLYSRKRSAFGERFGAEMSGSVGSTGMDQEQFNKAGPLIAELDALAKEIRADSKKWFEGSSRVFMEVAEKLEAHFKEVGFPKFELANYSDVKGET